MNEADFREKDLRMNGNLVIPSADLPMKGMKMRISTKDGMLTIEFEKSVSWLQFNKADANGFVQGMAAHIRGME